MKKTWLAVFCALFLLIGLLISCSGGGDDDNDSGGDDDVADDDSGDDDNADDDNADDDSAVDDDTITGDLTVDNVSQSECLDGANGGGKALWDPMVDPTNVIQVAWQDGVLKVDDFFAYLNCGQTIEAAAEAAGNTVTITETPTGTIMDCYCPFNVHYEVSGIDVDSIQLVVVRESSEKMATETIVELNLPLGAANKQWMIPFVEVFSYAGTNTQQDPIIVRYAACRFYHLEDQQFFIRRSGNSYFVQSYDWMDLDNPGTPNEQCQMPVTQEIGVLPPGEYYFFAPSFDDGEWSMLYPKDGVGNDANPLVID